MFIATKIYGNSKEKFFPVFDFTTEFNSKKQIIKYLDFAKGYLNLYFSNSNDESLIRYWKISPIVVTFYSIKAINSLLFSFNSCDLITYVEWTYKIMSKKEKFEESFK